MSECPKHHTTLIPSPPIVADGIVLGVALYHCPRCVEEDERQRSEDECTAALRAANGVDPCPADREDKR